MSDIKYIKTTKDDMELLMKVRIEMLREVNHLPEGYVFDEVLMKESRKHFEDENIYAKSGMTLTNAFNTFIQQSLNVEGLPFIVTKNSKEALKEQAIAMLMLDLKHAEERADAEGWIDADDLERELGVLD